MGWDIVVVWKSTGFLTERLNNFKKNLYSKFRNRVLCCQPVSYIAWQDRSVVVGPLITSPSVICSDNTWKQKVFCILWTITSISVPFNNWFWRQKTFVHFSHCRDDEDTDIIPPKFYKKIYLLGGCLIDNHATSSFFVLSG